jgi:hypothetical protein
MAEESRCHGAAARHALAHYIKRWMRPLAARTTSPRWPRSSRIAGMVLAPSFMAVVLVLGLRALFASFDMRDRTHRRRAGPRHRAGAGALSACTRCPSRWARTAGSVLGTAAHVRDLGAISFQVLGWFSGIERTLDAST